MTEEVVTRAPYRCAVGLMINTAEVSEQGWRIRLSLRQGGRLRGPSATGTCAASGQEGPGGGPEPPEMVHPEPVWRGCQAEPGASSASMT
jgi:hypothetical protein